MKNGDAVRRFEAAFAEYVGARYAIALCNGTATLHTALKALGVGPGHKVAVPPLTMASTTIAVLHAGAEPVFVDVDPDTWLMSETDKRAIGVSLYGLHHRRPFYVPFIDDAAQTIRPHHHGDAPVFTSYSFQASKILPLGEGGMLTTNDEDLARRAREFSSLGYRMDAASPRIDPATLKSPDFTRHHSLGWNYRMSDHVAREGLRALQPADATLAEVPGARLQFDCGLGALVHERYLAATYYRDAIGTTDWITAQHVPEGWQHAYWTYAVALESADLWHPFVEAIENHGGERPYAAWRLTYQEPAFRHLAPDGTCPVAEDLQPRLVQFQTNDVEQAKRNAEAVAGAIRGLGG